LKRGVGEISCAYGGFFLIESKIPPTGEQDKTLTWKKKKKKKNLWSGRLYHATASMPVSKREGGRGFHSVVHSSPS